MAGFDEAVSVLRKKLRPLGDEIMALHKQIATGMFPPESTVAEMHANVTLAYRHVEDAVMRLGKAIQAFDGGVSVYDK